MVAIWQAPDEISFLFKIFLLIFILVSLVPFAQKIWSRIRDFVRARARLGGPPGRPASMAWPEASGEPTATGRLSDYEYIIFRHLALAGGKGLSLKAITDDLHLGRSRVELALRSLGRKGLVGLAVGILFGRRYFLTRKGRDYALEQDIILKTRPGAKR